MRLVPKGPRMYVILEPVKEKVIGGIYVPDLHSELTRIAVVQAIGEDVTRYKVGDRVIMSYNAGRVINPVVDGFTPTNDTHRIITEEEVLAQVVED